MAELSVDALHATLSESSVAAVIRTFAGTVGGVLSTPGRSRGAEEAGPATARTASAAQVNTSQRAFIGCPSPETWQRCRCWYTHAPPRGFSGRSLLHPWIVRRVGVLGRA